MSAFAFIFARGGSKGIPRKNLQILAGKPLLAWSIESAKQCTDIDRVIISTEDAEIAEVARRHGAEVPFIRPAELAADDSPEWLSWKHAIGTMREQSGPFDVFVSVPATSPLRDSSDLSDAVRLLNGGGCDAVVSITPAARNPYFNMVRMSEDGGLAVAVQPTSVIANRQAAPKLFDITTVVYAVKPDYILTATSLMQGRVKGLVIPRERALDIDDEVDLQFAEFMIQKRRKQ